MMRLKPIYIIMFVCARVLAGCNSSDDGGNSTALVTDSAVVSFSTEVNTEVTRATTGIINNLAALKKVGEGFGVFAYLTDGQNHYSR